MARERAVALAVAQQALAKEYGFQNWAAMLRYVSTAVGVVSVERPLIFAAVEADDVVSVRALLAEGVNPRITDGRETPLHTAVRLGSLRMVETLIAGGALEWQLDHRGRTPLDIAKRGRARERAALIELLDRAIVDPSFRAAVGAIQKGDVKRLVELLDSEPRLLRERAVGPEVYRQARRRGYFTDPKLFWFVANNPTSIDTMPANIVDIARVMMERGVEQGDLDYALGLMMTSSVAREQGHQLPLMRALLAGGATPTRDTILSTAAHRELGALRALVAAGEPMSAPIAGALGRVDVLPTLLAASNADDIAAAFGLAVINRELEAARLALDAGADVNAFLPIHSHSTALHQAAGDDNVPMIDLLLSRGARPDARDTLWDGTPLGWAIHGNRSAARQALEAATKTLEPS
jgi:peptide-methionine (S)-S-oxide reductase